RNYDGGLKKSDGGLSLFCQSGKTLGAPKQHDLEANELEQAHIYILKNCDEVLPFLEEFAQIHVDSTQHLSDDEWNRQFIEWFQDKVAQFHKEDDSRSMEDLLALSRGPTKYVLHYNGVVAKGRGKGLRSMSNAQGVRTMNKNYLSVEKGHIPSFSSTDELMQYIKTNSSSAQGKSQGLKSMWLN
ncbi:hypothetical protein H5410_033561, partial [Solanum commersonii]